RGRLIREDQLHAESRICSVASMFMSRSAFLASCCAATALLVQPAIASASLDPAFVGTWRATGVQSGPGVEQMTIVVTEADDNGPAGTVRFAAAGGKT